MALSIDWANGIINVPKDYTTLVQISPTEIRDLDTNQFRLDLKALEWSVEGMPFVKTHDHNPPVSVGGIELARVISITDDYTITFEDGAWAVNLKGSNNNILDRTNKNQVSVNPGNSAGLVTSEAIEFGEYGGLVTLDVENGTGNAGSGSVYPWGTLRKPVDNFADAVLIAQSKGFSKIRIISDCSLDVDAEFNYFTLEGLSHVQTQLTIQAAADVLGVTINNVELTGVLDGGSEVNGCVVRDVNYFNGHIHDSSIGGTVTLGGLNESFISNCSRLEGETVPTIDFNNEANHLVMPRYSGVMKLVNISDALTTVMVGLDQGQLVLDSTSDTAGNLSVSGIGSLVDETGTDIITGAWNGMAITNMLISNESITSSVWAYER